LDKIKINCFRAIDYPELAKEFVKGHRQVLFDHGVKYVFSSEDYWIHDENTLVCIAMVDDKIVGGTRIEQLAANRNLPIEQSIHRLDPTISTIVSGQNINGTAELCGLWMNQDFSGSNLSLIMSRYLVANAHHLQIESIFCLAASYTFWIVKNLGFEMITKLGNNGLFNYPTNEYRTGVWIMPDVKQIGITNCESREILASLTKKPNQLREEDDLKPKKSVEYDAHF
jgi:hypothetical protein